MIAVCITTFKTVEEKKQTHQKTKIRLNFLSLAGDSTPNVRWWSTYLPPGVLNSIFDDGINVDVSKPSINVFQRF